MITENILVREINQQFGSVSKMISKVINQVEYLIEYDGYKGRDRSETLDRALNVIPSKYYPIYYKYRYTTARP